MTYEYIIFQPGSTEDIAAQFDSVAPVPHIQVGHCLLLVADGYSHQTGHHLLITDVEVYIFARTDAPERIRTSVYTRERDRRALLDGFK